MEIQTEQITHEGSNPELSRCEATLQTSVQTPSEACQIIKENLNKQIEDWS